MISTLRTFVAAIGVLRFVVLVVVPVCYFAIVGSLTALQAAREAARRAMLQTGNPVEATETYYAMRAEFPVIPLGDRLSYESGTDSSDDISPTPNLSSAAEQLLIQFEKKAEFDARRRTLAKLHDESYAHFVEREGFGFGRMKDVGRLHWDTILVPEPLLVSLPKAPQESESAYVDSDPTPTAADFLPTIELSILHNDGYFDFVNPPRLGVVPVFDRTLQTRSESSPFAIHPVSRVWSELPADSRWRPLSVGFISHGMTNDLNHAFQDRQAEWQISKLELVSLRKFREPRAYLSTNLPSMEELKNAKTRPIEEFEQQALQQLRNGEELVIDSHLNRVRMVGAVRAAEQCLACHAVRRGALLGAFSYSLHRKQPIVRPKVERQTVSLLRQ